MFNFDNLYKDDCTYVLRNEDIDPLKSYLAKKQGWIYIVKSHDNNFLKIGRTSKDPMTRAKSLSSTGVVHSYDVLFATPVFNQFWVETQIHRKLKNHRVLKEFFLVSRDIAVQVIVEESQRELTLLNRFFDTNMVRQDLNLLDHAIIEVH